MVEVIYVFRGPGIHGFVFDNETQKPLKNIEIQAELWDWYDYFYNTTYTDEKGYYEFKTPEGFIDIICYHPGYRPYYSNVTVKPNQVVKKDIYLDKIPPETSKVYGYVFDSETSEPLYDVEVELDDMIYYDYYNWTYTDEEGYYEMNAPEGTFNISVWYWDWYSDIDYEYYQYEITLSKKQELKHDIYLKRERPDEKNITYEFSPSNWDYVSQTIRTTIYTDSDYYREDMDENFDGTVSEAEVSAYELQMETMYEFFLSNYTTNDTFMVDNTSYIYVKNSVDFEYEGATGSVYSGNPFTTIMMIDLRSNSTISISNNHSVQIFVEYDSGYETYIYFIKFPSLFEMTNYTEQENITISGANEVRIDPLMDPYWWRYWGAYIIMDVERIV
jgi:hypothetical protein